MTEQWGPVVARAARLRLAGRTYAVLIFIASQTKSVDGRRLPVALTHDEISEGTNGIDRRDVSKATAVLEAHHLVAIERGGPGRANIYAILLDVDESATNSPPPRRADLVGESAADLVGESAAHLVGESAAPLTESPEQNSEESASRSPRAHVRDPGNFEIFWEAYPHQVAKPAAEAAYRRATAEGANPADVLAGVHRYVAAKPPDRQWCNPATFLKQQRWLDRPAPQQASLYLSFEGGKTNGTGRSPNRPSAADHAGSQRPGEIATAMHAVLSRGKVG